jgi:hypothetical protein
MNDKYKKTMSQIQASHQFKQETLRLLSNGEVGRKKKMKMPNKLAVSFAVCLALGAGVTSFNMLQSSNSQQSAILDLTERIEVDPNAPSGSAIVNVEGTIVEVSEDGLRFKLDNGKWIIVTDETEIGITGPTAAPKEEQYFEPTFRVGNSISGFTLEENKDEMIAYAIYTNWNWEDPIKE